METIPNTVCQRELLIASAAMIVAEVERIDRATGGVLVVAPLLAPGAHPRPGASIGELEAELAALQAAPIPNPEALVVCTEDGTRLLAYGSTVLAPFPTDGFHSVMTSTKPAVIEIFRRNFASVAPADALTVVSMLATDAKARAIASVDARLTFHRRERGVPA